MKNYLLIATLIAASSANIARADVGYQDLRSAGVFLGTAIAGAVVAGPVGMLAAASSGVWLDEKVSKAAELDRVEVQLSEAETEISLLNHQLALYKTSAERYAQAIQDQLQLELLFKTGQSELTDYGHKRLAVLADFMTSHSELQIRLDGYADPRGKADDNLALSNDRVVAVAKQLESFGIHKSRINTFSHGASQSVAQQGDVDSYALERVVRIQLSAGKQITADTVAQRYISQ